MLKLTALQDPGFSLRSLNKYASVMATSNGLLGVRATHEEDYTTQTRGMYLAGLYHAAGKNEINELVNLPDLIGVEFELNGEIFSLQSGELLSWQRELDFTCGELRRRVLWRSPAGKRYQIDSSRFASRAQRSLLAMRIAVTSLDAPLCLRITTGIDATQTNSGRQHLDERSVRVFEQHYLQGLYATQDGETEIAIGSVCRFASPAESCFVAKNRRLLQHSTVTAQAGAAVTLEKLSWIAARREKSASPEAFSAQGLTALKEAALRGYDALREASQACWRPFWQQSRVEVDADSPDDQTALDYALYHLSAMMPVDDEHSSIGAKALTGEGYKGHVFWDTEIFLLPFHLYTHPENARRLLRYRWLNLDGAREKARRNGWLGALFPWESARSGREETPEFAAINIRTGLRQKVASALAEHHIVADIAWAIVAYWQATHDDDFMRQEGLTLLKETAAFWLSRATEANGRLEIHDVIGPDEYTEHINNNAYTSYLAWYNVAQALYFQRQQGVDDAIFETRAKAFLDRLWLPEVDASGVMPQDDSFMSKPAIALEKYKAQAGKQTILLDYSRAEVNEMQVLKQADVVMLTYLLPELFSTMECRANLAFYEPLTIHDSSLSKTIHGIVAARCGNREQAYSFWKDGVAIDLGPDLHSCDDGIHAAATGAIWLGAIQGFAGMRVEEGVLHLSPALPVAWRRLRFPLRWRGVSLMIDITPQSVSILACASVTLMMWGTRVTCDQGTTTFLPPEVSLSETGTATTEGKV